MRVFSLILLIFANSTFATTLSNSPSRAVPEAFTGLNYSKAAYSDKAMISAANPHAVNAGIEMLKKGGSAVDAAVAIQAVLTLVEPQSSGIGGGAFMMLAESGSNELITYDGRETAPASATPDLFLQPDGKPVRWIDAVIGGRSVGTPGVVKMLAQAHQKHGKLPWKTLFQPAIELAQNGFVVSPRLAKLVAGKFNPGIAQLSEAKRYFYPNGQAIAEGDVLTNKKLAATLTKIAEQGVSAFYQGDIAKRIVAAVQNSEVSPGLLTEQDLKAYTAKQRPAVCTDYQAKTGNYKVCSMGPPSSGGLTVLQILELLEPLELGDTVTSTQTVHLYTQAAKLAFADRNRYLADSDFVAVPSQQDYLSPSYIASRRQQISASSDLGVAKPGIIGTEKLANNSDISQPNTSHFSIVDQFGNALSMTTTIEMGFGSAVMVEGFLLNNQLTDFSLVPEKNGKLVSNRVEGGKRPRSSMSPVIVFKDNEVFAVIGSPGGSRIINYVGYALIGLLDYGLDMKQVADLARVSNRNSVTALEKGLTPNKLKRSLEKLGHKVKMVNMTSGIHGVLKTDKGWQGAADPRREGTAVGL